MRAPMRHALLAAGLAVCGVAAAQDFDQASIRTERVGDGLWVFFGEGPDVITEGDPLVDFGCPGESALVVDRDERVDGVLGGVGLLQRSLHPLSSRMPGHER